jgi:hypothetical protein
MLGYNIWDFAGDSDEKSVNTMVFQYFVNYNIKNGWYLTSTPVITANWEEDSDERWTVPVGLGVGRLVKFGKQPVDFKLQPFWYVEKPTTARIGHCSFRSNCFFRSDESNNNPNRKHNFCKNKAANIKLGG